MSLKWIAIALLLGAATASWVHRDVIIAAVNPTDEITRGITASQDIAIAREEIKYEQTRVEVRTIYVETRAKIMALPPDSVARELNAELAMWRGVESNPGGVDE
jgi:hypothetical protein